MPGSYQVRVRVRVRVWVRRLLHLFGSRNARKKADAAKATAQAAAAKEVQSVEDTDKE